MDDRELLERAAKAAGLTLQYYKAWGVGAFYLPGELHPWNPLEDDGDAFRLAVKLAFRVQPGQVDWTDEDGTFQVEVDERTPYPYADLETACAATRRAIVRAAAAIGAANDPT